MGVQIPPSSPKTIMNKNKLLYNAAMSLVQSASFIRPIDRNLSKLLLAKAQEYKDQIVAVDEKVEKEIDEFEKGIREGL
jgi:hypothetical protein